MEAYIDNKDNTLVVTFDTKQEAHNWAEIQARDFTVSKCLCCNDYNSIYKFKNRIDAEVYAAANNIPV